MARRQPRAPTNADRPRWLVIAGTWRNLIARRVSMLNAVRTILTAV